MFSELKTLHAIKNKQNFQLMPKQTQNKAHKHHYKSTLKNNS